MSDEQKVFVYTKGSGENKEGECGWAYKLEYVPPKKDIGTDSFRTEMHAVLSALRAIDDKSVSVEIFTNNEEVAKICSGIDTADKSKEMYDQVKEEEKRFIEANGKVTYVYIPKEDNEEPFKDLKKAARNGR